MFVISLGGFVGTCSAGAWLERAEAALRAQAERLSETISSAAETKNTVNIDRGRSLTPSTTDGEQFFLASCEPAPTSRDLTLGAVPIAAGGENDGTMATTGTLIAMSTQDRGTAVGDRTEHFLMRPVNPAAVIGDEVFALCPYNVGHLHVWPIHFFCSLRDRYT